MKKHGCKARGCGENVLYTFELDPLIAPKHAAKFLFIFDSFTSRFHKVASLHLASNISSNSVSAHAKYDRSSNVCAAFHLDPFTFWLSSSNFNDSSRVSLFASTSLESEEDEPTLLSSDHQ